MADERLHARINLLEHMADQQERLNTLLIDVTARLGEEHQLYAQTQPRHEMRLELLTVLASQHEERMEQFLLLAAQHEERMAILQRLLEAMKDMRDRGNGH